MKGLFRNILPDSLKAATLGQKTEECHRHTLCPAVLYGTVSRPNQVDGTHVNAKIAVDHTTD